MKHALLNCSCRRLFFLAILFFIGLGPWLSPWVHAQLMTTESYELRVAPDLGFNAVDGVLVGARFRGEDPRTFLDGPHRLNAGINIATRFPDTPVSYYLSYTHPIDVLSGDNSEGAYHVFSSIRTGWHFHETGIHKRWQPGFDEFVSTELQITGGFYRRFDMDYVLYESLWQDDPILFLRSFLKKKDRNPLGRWTLAFSAKTGAPVRTDSGFIDFDGQLSVQPEALGVTGLFGQMHMEALQQVDLSSLFFIRTRLFAGTSSGALPPEHRYLVSDANAFERMESRLTRARGTIPQSWMESGWIQISGGPGLRGYTFQTTEQLEQGGMPWVQHAAALNLDVYYPNPIHIYFSKIPYLGDLIRLDSYIFTDAGYLFEQSEWQDLKWNAGAGFMFSLNVPDYLGRDRGFFIRYELPLWISEVSPEEDSFKVRHLLGIGAQYRF